MASNLHRFERISRRSAVVDSRTSYETPEIERGVSAIEDDLFWYFLDPEIIKISKSRFCSGHYADSVEAAFKEINQQVKEKVKVATGEELDGAGLMNKAFSPKQPIICLGDLSTDSGKNIQQGYMLIFSGAMTGIRNPSAHENLEISKNLAIHLLYLASLLMSMVSDDDILPQNK